MNRNDLRFQKTEDGIRTAFLYCVDTIGFEKTRISDICDRARISRNTFYVHYEDKYSLMKSIFSDLEKEMFNSFEENIKQDLYDYKMESSVAWSIKEVGKHRELLKVLMKCSKTELCGVFERAFIDRPLSIMTADYGKKSAPVEASLNKSYILNAMVGFMETWLNNYDKISEKKAIALLMELCSVPVGKYFDKVLK